MIEASLSMGALAAGADDASTAALRQYGRCFGLAFQITDDLLDVQGNEAQLGKRVGKDAQHGKLTFPGVLGMDASRRQAQALIDEACRQLARFGERGAGLAALARFVLERKH
jgi:geranylgeranyl diphosphate synthase type II